MSTKYLYFSGIIKWAKVRKPDEKYQNYTINLYLDSKSKETFDDSGLSLGFKNDEDGEFITFRRPDAKLIKQELVHFGPPTVLGPDNKPFDGLIGNGSKVTAKVAVYDTIKGKGHRLEIVRVDDLVVYEGGDNGMPPVTKATATAATPPVAQQMPF